MPSHKREIKFNRCTDPLKAFYAKTYDEAKPDFINERYPGWTRKMVINYWSTGDYLNELPDYNEISLAEDPYLPTSAFAPVRLERPPPNHHQVPVPPQEIIFNNDQDAQPQAQPQLDQPESEDLPDLHEEEEEIFHDAIQSPPPRFVPSEITPGYNPRAIRDTIKYGTFTK